MFRYQKMSWHIEVNNKKFINKLDAIRENLKTNKALNFNAPDSWEIYDFSKKPNKSLEELCIIQAKEIRSNHEFVNLWYSGGCDSHYILQIFLNNNIKIDELTMVKRGIKAADFEIDDYAIPFAKTTGIKCTVRQPDMKYYEDYYINKKPMFGTANEYHHHFGLNNHFENLMHCNTNATAHVFGKEKPRLTFIDGKWYTYLMDIDVTHQPNQINFFCDDPEIYSAQCHLLKSEAELMLNQSEFNKIMDIENQDFLNRAIERYKENNFPVKKGYPMPTGEWNNKDTIAIDQSPEYIVKAWKNKNEELTNEIGTKWFNQGDPAIGTIGVFSKFYCISERSTKTVDELFPNGFKIQ